MLKVAFSTCGFCFNYSKKQKQQDISDSRGFSRGSFTCFVLVRAEGEGSRDLVHLSFVSS